MKLSTGTCEKCGVNDLNGGCGPNGAEWGSTDDGLLEARLLTMLEEKEPLDAIMEELQFCEVGLGRAVMLLYTEGLFDVVCTL